MTSGGGIWDVLGIAPTDDRRAIRSAYAARLKAIDVEADPKAFIAVREAMEMALAAAERRVWHSEPDTAAKAQDDGTETLAKTRVELDDQFALERETRRLAELLDADFHPGVTEHSLVECLNRIWSNPSVHHIETGEEIEHWLAHIIADRLPRSDPLIAPALDRYGWRGHDKAVEHYGAPAAIIARADDLEALARITRPDHRYYEAFKLLERHPETVPARRRRVMERELRDVLQALRVHYPTLEWHFGESLLQAWVDDIETPRWGRPSLSVYTENAIHVADTAPDRTFSFQDRVFLLYIAGLILLLYLITKTMNS